MTDDDLYYRLDAEDRIVEVGGNWDPAARQGGGDAIVSGNVEGRPLFSFITGRSTREFVWTMLDGVRKIGGQRAHIYRCDTPDLKRTMQMVVSAEENGALRLSHRLLAVEPMLRSVRFASAQKWTVGPPLVRCSNCNRLRVDQVWLEPDAIPLDPPNANPKETTVIYGVCEPCQQVSHLPRDRRGIASLDWPTLRS